MQIPLKEGIGGEREGDFTNNSNNYMILVYGIIPSAWLFCQGWLAHFSYLPGRGCQIAKFAWLFGYWGIMPSCQMGCLNFFSGLSKLLPQKIRLPLILSFFSTGCLRLPLFFLPSFFPSLSFPLFVCFSFLNLMAF